VVLCLDEKPNIQVLERRCPTYRVRPGLIEKREFEYVRHGTVNFLVKLEVHTGQMRGWCLERNDSACLRAVLPELLEEYADALRIHLIWDNGSSHVSRETLHFLRHNSPHVRVLFTPAHASWLNQAELLLRAFGAHYLQRGDWASRSEFIAHLEASWPEYNQLYAHPFTWSWTRPKLREWVARHRLRQPPGRFQVEVGKEAVNEGLALNVDIDALAEDVVKVAWPYAWDAPSLTPSQEWVAVKEVSMPH
jgi:transposase